MDTHATGLAAGHIGLILGLVGFSLASVLFPLTFGKPSAQTILTRLALSAFVAATLAITWSLVATGLSRADGAGLPTGVMLASCLGWLTIAAYAWLKIKPLGAFLAPLVTLILLLQLFVAPPVAGPGLTSEVPLLAAFHVGMAILGQAFAIGACGVSIFYLWSRSALKRRQLGQLPAQVPAIDRLEKMLVGCLWAGFAFITAGLVTGALYTQLHQIPTGGELEAKVVWALVVWVWYLATLIARNVLNHPGRRIAQMSLGGFVLMAAAYFGMIFFRIPGGL